MSSVSEHYTLNDKNAEAFWFLGTLATIKASGALTGGVMSVVEFIHPPGFATPKHLHITEDEAFYILEGTMKGFSGDKQWRATAGSFVWLPHGIAHGYAVDGDATLRSLAITVPSGFDGFVTEVGEIAPARTLPPPSAPDIPKLLAAAAKYGQEILGPPEA